MANGLTVTTPTDREIVMTRDFNAPRHLVYEALCKPEFLKRWLLGPPGWTMTVCENDPRVGGQFRHVWRMENGTEMAMHGVYREVRAPERLVRTETFDVGCPPQMGEQVGTLELADLGGRTRLTLTVVYPSKEARDGAAASGMEHGVAAGYNRLDEVLASAA